MNEALDEFVYAICQNYRKDTGTCRTGGLIDYEWKKKKVGKEGICPFNGDGEGACSNYEY